MDRRTLFRNLPNIITLGRLLLVPAVVSLIASESWVGAFLAFSIAGLSDAVDGFLAKHFGLRTELGAYLDPLADKALLVSIYVTLAIIDVVPRNLTILIVSRDVMIVGAVIVAWFVDRPVQIKPLWISKLNTAAQIAFAGAILAAKAFGFALDGWVVPMVFAVATLTLASMAAYLGQWLKHMSS